MCFAPQRHGIFRHLKFKKWARAYGVLCILTYKCASRHSGVPFFQIWTSKTARNLRCFVLFDLMRFAPQRRAILAHRNFKNRPAHVVLCAFWLANVLPATATCHFSTSELQKLVRECGVCGFWLENVLRATAACHFSTLCRRATSAPAALANLLFEHQEPRINEKHSDSRLS